MFYWLILYDAIVTDHINVTCNSRLRPSVRSVCLSICFYIVFGAAWPLNVFWMQLNVNGWCPWLTRNWRLTRSVQPRLKAVFLVNLAMFILELHFPKFVNYCQLLSIMSAKITLTYVGMWTVGLTLTVRCNVVMAGFNCMVWQWLLFHTPFLPHYH